VNYAYLIGGSGTGTTSVKAIASLSYVLTGSGTTYSDTLYVPQVSSGGAWSCPSGTSAVLLDTVYRKSSYYKWSVTLESGVNPDNYHTLVMPVLNLLNITRPSTNAWPVQLSACGEVGTPP